jgi:hypothetical protein
MRKRDQKNILEYRFNFSSKIQVSFALVFAVIGGIILRQNYALNSIVPGDVNNDSVVNLTDLSILLSNYSTINASSDINKDGMTDIIDLSILLSHYGEKSVPINCTGTLQSKINTASVGAFIDLSGCTYNESPVINKNLTLHGPTINGELKIDGRSTGQIIIVTVENVSITNTSGYGISVWSSSLKFRDSTVKDCLRGGIRDYETSNGSIYERLLVLNNGKDTSVQYNGDGILAQGINTIIRNNQIINNGQNVDFEHGIYVANNAQNISILDNYIKDNSGAGIKMGGTGEIRRNTINGNRIGLVYDGSVNGSASVKNNDIRASYVALLETSTSTLNRFESNFNVYHTNAFLKQNSGVVDLLTWRTLTNQDLNSEYIP